MRPALIRVFIGSCLRRRRTHYWRCCRPDESCRQRAPRLQPASPHIPRCPDLLRLSTVSGGGRALHSFLGWSVFSFGGRAGEKIRILTLRTRSEEHTSELQSHSDLVCRLLLEKKKKKIKRIKIDI